MFSEAITKTMRHSIVARKYSVTARVFGVKGDTPAISDLPAQKYRKTTPIILFRPFATHVLFNVYKEEKGGYPGDYRVDQAER